MPEGDWINGTFLQKCRQPEFSVYDKSPKYGFGWWFGYFWKEARGAGASDAELQAVFAKVYENLKPKGPLPTKYSEKRSALEAIASKVTTLKQPDDLMRRPQHYRDILVKLFEIGFVAMPRETVASPLTVPMLKPEGQLAFQQRAKQAFAIRVQAEDAGHQKHCMAIGFRGDGRGFALVSEHEGALNRIDMAHHGTKAQRQNLAYLNLHQPWHPFSDATFAHKSKMYYRRTSGDNCLFSVLSIGDRVELSLGFPLIEDQEIYTYERAKPIDQWKYADFRQLGGGVKLALVRGSFPGGKTRGIFLGTENHVYAVKFSPKKHLAHTQNVVGQLTQDYDQCPERGVRGVKMENFLAGVKFRRIHFGPKRCCGTAGVVQDCKYYYGDAWHANWDTRAVADYHFLSDTRAAESARAQLAGLINVPILVGERTEGPAMSISRIEQWDLTYDQLKAHRDLDVKQELYYGPVS